MEYKSVTKICWSKKENDYIITWDKDFKSNAEFINSQILDKDFLKELEKRGYNLKSLKFAIKKIKE